MFLEKSNAPCMWRYKKYTCNTVVTTMIRLRFDGCSSAVQRSLRSQWRNSLAIQLQSRWPIILILAAVQRSSPGRDVGRRMLVARTNHGRIVVVTAAIIEKSSKVTTNLTQKYCCHRRSPPTWLPPSMALYIFLPFFVSTQNVVHKFRWKFSEGHGMCDWQQTIRCWSWSDLRCGFRNS